MWTPERWMREWTNRGRATLHRHEHEEPRMARPHGRAMSGTYLLLHTYLAERYADTVVLTFAQIEDVLGFALPAQARQHPEWWTDASPDAVTLNYSDSWVLADRTAVPNLLAKTVAFDRVLQGR
jgi:hypothetical protein